MLYMQNDPHMLRMVPVACLGLPSNIVLFQHRDSAMGSGSGLFLHKEA